MSNLRLDGGIGKCTLFNRKLLGHISEYLEKVRDNTQGYY